MTQLSKEDIDFIQLVLSRCPYNGIPNALAQYLERYVSVMQKLEEMKNKQEQTHLEGVGV